MSFLNHIRRALSKRTVYRIALAISILQVISLYLLVRVVHDAVSTKSNVQSVENVANVESVARIRKNKTLIIYAYFEKNKAYKKSLRHFIDAGVQESDHVDYLFVIQNKKCTPILPTQYVNVHVLKRENTCFDFGAYGKGIEFMGGWEYLKSKYKYFAFINPSAFGPILPKYWPEDIHWIEIFTARFKDNVHAVGASMSCHEFGPVLDGWFFAADYLAVEAGLKAGALACHKTKAEAIDNGEFGMSKAIIAAGLNMDNLLLKYPSQIDWTNNATWDLNICIKSPMWHNGYSDDHNKFKFNVHPLETVFFKSAWYHFMSDPFKQGGLITSAFYNETMIYIDWALKRKKAADRQRLAKKRYF